MNKSEWLICPLCKHKTRVKVRADTTIENLPLFCPKCKNETLVSVKKFQMIIIQEPDVKRRADKL